MTKRRVGRFAGAALSCLLAAAPLLTWSDPATADDTTTRAGQALVCLSDDNRDRVVDAALLLHLAERGKQPGDVVVAGKELSVKQWQASPDSTFPRACEAVVTAIDLQSTGAASSSPTDWATLVPLLIGAGITLITTLFTTFVTSGWRDRVAEARRQTVRVRRTTSDFIVAVEDFLAVAVVSTRGLPSGVPLEKPRTELRRALDELPRHDRSPGARLALELLSTGALGEGIVRDWPGARTPDSNRVKQIRTAVADLRVQVDRAITVREQPIRTFLLRRNRSTSQESVTTA